MVYMHTQITDRVPAAALPRSTQPAHRRIERMRSALPPEGEFVVRELSDADRVAAERLAERDSATLPAGPLLGAEANGELIAVRALDGGAVIADPFRPTRSARELLAVRARQLDAEHGPRRRFRLPRLPRARGAIAGSPPGGASNLLQL